MKPILELRPNDLGIGLHVIKKIDSFGPADMYLLSLPGLSRSPFVFVAATDRVGYRSKEYDFRNEYGEPLGVPELGLVTRLLSQLWFNIGKSYMDSDILPSSVLRKVMGGKAFRRYGNRCCLVHSSENFRKVCRMTVDNFTFHETAFQEDELAMVVPVENRIQNFLAAVKTRCQQAKVSIDFPVNLMVNFETEIPRLMYPVLSMEHVVYRSNDGQHEFGLSQLLKYTEHLPSLKLGENCPRPIIKVPREVTEHLSAAAVQLYHMLRTADSSYGMYSADSQYVSLSSLPPIEYN